MGLNAAIAEVPYETTAETGQPCQVNFVKTADFLKFLAEHGEASLHAAMQVGNDCQQAYQQLRSFTMSSSSRANGPTDSGMVARGFRNSNEPRNQGSVDPR